MSVKQKAEVSKPSAGYSTTRHPGKDNISALANAGAVPHPEKLRKGETIAVPEAGARDRGKDPKTATHPGAGVADQHLDKHAYEKARKHEPKPKGKYQTGESTTKC
jgi:hypothetical protein